MFLVAVGPITLFLSSFDVDDCNVPGFLRIKRRNEFTSSLPVESDIIGLDANVIIIAIIVDLMIDIGLIRLYRNCSYYCNWIYIH